VNRRRATLVAFGLGAIAPRTGFSQRRVWRIGYLSGIEPSVYVARLDAFRAGMRTLGMNEGRDYVIEVRSSNGDLARLAALAAELVALKVDLILTAGTPTVLAAQKATRDIPILTTTAGDPVATGIVPSLARPGGNVTGMSSMSSDIYPKSLDLLRQLRPGLTRVGILYDPDNRIDGVTLARLEAVVKAQSFTLIRAPVRNATDVAPAFATLERNKVQALVATNGSTNVTLSKAIIENATRMRLPAAFPRGDFADAGGLISYGTDYVDLYRRAADYAVRIMKGEKPADLPIQQPTRFELVINFKTAAALGLKVPPEVLLQSTRVIE
jgi:putative ABC transport system substrate-binding protein